MYTYIYMHTHICIYTYQNFYHVLSPLGHFHGSLKKTHMVKARRNYTLQNTQCLPSTHTQLSQHP